MQSTRDKQRKIVRWAALIGGAFLFVFAVLSFYLKRRSRRLSRYD